MHEIHVFELDGRPLIYESADLSEVPEDAVRRGSRVMTTEELERLLDELEAQPDSRAMTPIAGGESARSPPSHGPAGEPGPATVWSRASWRDGVLSGFCPPALTRL
jgi:hypothetical protein